MQPDDYLIDPEHQLAKLGLELPAAPKPIASYVPAVRSGGLVFISGQIPVIDGEVMARGTVPDEVSVDLARQCAQRCALNGLSVLKTEIGSLTAVRRVVRLGGFVACRPGFDGQSGVINGASDLLFEVFGERGRHARAAVGSIGLPLGVPVEIEFLFEVE